MVGFLERMGSAVCHRLAERSFIWDKGQMPLCARCTGIYIGVLFAFCFLFLNKRMQRGKPFSMKQAVLTAIVILPIGVDGIGSYLGLWESSQWMRVFSGSLVGVVVPAFLLLAVNYDAKKEMILPIYEKEWELPVLMAVSALFGLCLWAGLPLMEIGSMLSVAGEVLLWGGLVWLILKTFLKGKKIPYWKISLVISFAGLFLMGGLAS